MIKTYSARVNQNSISYLLYGKQGNQMRFPFSNGNVIINKYPSLTLRNRYCQELLESSSLFANKVVILDHEEEDPFEAKQFYTEDTTAKSTEEDVQQETPTKKDCVIEITSVTSADELLAFVNKEDGRDESNMFKTPARALKWATEHNYSFPNYNPA